MRLFRDRAAGVVRRILPVLLLWSCSGDSSTGPANPEVGTSYVGVLSVAGAEDLGGMFQVATPNRTSTQLSGVLVTNGGGVVTLTGTVNGSSLALVGGAYTITASASGGTMLAGTGTAPGGFAAVVSAPVLPPTTTPAPSNPTGTYTGSFMMSGTLNHRNTNTAGQVTATCSVPLRFTGTLELHLHRTSDGMLDSHVDVRWTEASQSSGNCPPNYSYSQTDYYGIDFVGTASSLVATRADIRGNATDATGRLSRSISFIGAVSGSTVVGSVGIGFNFTVPITGGTHVEWIPTATTTVTLTKK